MQDLAPHPFTLRQAQYAVAVARELNFRRAAEACGISQPALSGQLAALEEELGLRLFERNRTSVAPTPDGERLLPLMRALLGHADAVTEAAVLARDPLGGVLRIGAIPTIAPYVVPSALGATRGPLPRLDIAWSEDKTAVLADRLRKGEIDGALLALEHCPEDVERAELARDEFLLAMPLLHPLGKGGGPVDAAALAGEAVLLLEDGHCFRDQALAFCQDRQLRAHAFAATSLPTLVRLVADGRGITLLPRLALSTEVSRADVLIRPFTSPAPGRTLGLVWRRRHRRRAALRAVADVLRTIVAG